MLRGMGERQPASRAAVAGGCESAWTALSRTDVRRRACCDRTRRMSYETLAVERVNDDLIVLTRRGWQFRVIGVPHAKLRTAALAVRWKFRSAEVAWRAFEFAVASERLWGVADATQRFELGKAVRSAGVAFRDAAMRHDDPPGVGGLAELIARETRRPR